MDAERFKHRWKWTWIGAVVGYFMPVLVGTLTIFYYSCRDHGFDADVLGFLPLLFLAYTALGFWFGHAFLGAGCGLACAWLPPWFGRWRRLAALTALVLVACLTASALYFQWFPMLWLS